MEVLYVVRYSKLMTDIIGGKRYFGVKYNYYKEDEMMESVGEKNMIKERYSSDKDKSIIEYEHCMFNEYQNTANRYANLFEGYGCCLETNLFWMDNQYEIGSGERLSFESGYSCYVKIKVTQNGEVVRCEDDEHEVDYYDLELDYGISYISRIFFKPTIVLIEKDNGVEEDIIRLLNLLRKRFIKRRTKKIT